MKEQQLKKIRWGIFIFCFTLMAWRAFTISIDSGGRDNVYGDSYSDFNTHSAVRYFYDSGFCNTYLLPMHQYDYSGDTTIGAYTHYPALPDIFAGTYAYMLNTTKESWLRVFPILLSMLWFFLIYRVLETLLKDKQQAFIGGSIIVLSNYFIAWGDNLHKHALEEFFKWLYVYCIYKYFTVDEKRKMWLAAMCILFILAVNSSFEPATYLAVISIGFSLLYTRKIFTPATIFPGIAAIVGFMLHMWQNAAYLGGWELAFEDMEAAFKLRTAGEATEGFTVNEIGDKDFTILDLLFEWFNRIERFFLIPGWAFILFLVGGMRHMFSNNKKLFYITLTILIATLSWSFAMMHHAYVHLFTSRQWGILIGVIMAYTVPLYYNTVQSAFAEKKYPAIIFHSLFILYIAAMAVSQQLYGLYLKHGFLYNYI